VASKVRSADGVETYNCHVVSSDGKVSLKYFQDRDSDFLNDYESSGRHQFEGRLTEDDVDAANAQHGVCFAPRDPFALCSRF
jgi:hypothetical protein